MTQYSHSGIECQKSVPNLKLRIYLKWSLDKAVYWRHPVRYQSPEALMRAYSFADLLQVIEEGAWSEAVGSALSKLGVHVLASQVLPLRALGSARELVHSASGLGVVSAVRAATAGEHSKIDSAFSAAELSAEERTQLCSFLLQVCSTSAVLRVHKSHACAGPGVNIDSECADHSSPGPSLPPCLCWSVDAD